MPWRRERTQDRPEARPRQDTRAAPAPSAADAVLALQRGAGNHATAALLARQPKPPHEEEFVLGADIPLKLAERAKELAAKAVGDAQLLELRKTALGVDESISDAERLFLTALLDPDNRKRLTAATVRSGTKLSLVLPLDKATRTNLQKVTDLERPGADPAKPAKGQILALAGADGPRSKRAAALVAFAESRKVPLPDVLGAMISAASDSTAGDQVSAGIVFAVAADAGHAAAAHVRKGAVKVDEWAFKGSASALYSPTSDDEVGKGDTISVRPTLDIANVEDRTTVIHELQHVLQDERAPGGAPQIADRGDAEVEAYTAEADYGLRQIAAMAVGKERRDAAKLLAKRWGQSAFAGAILASQADASGGSAKVLKEINALAPEKQQLKPRSLDILLTAPAKGLKKIIRDAQSTKPVRFDKLSGESRLSSLLPR